jgi:hypothetical protein
MIDRLTLTEKGVEAWPRASNRSPRCPTRSARWATFKFPPSGIQVGKMRVPLGVIGIIYEARPNVTADAAALCLKSGNAAILRGGSEAIRSNQAIAALVREGLPPPACPNAVQVIDTTDRAAVGELITMREFVDVIVPRGGKGLIERLLAECARADDQAPRRQLPRLHRRRGRPDKALRIVENAKTQRYGTCNTAESLLVARAVAAAAAADRRHAHRQGRRDPRLRRNLRWCRRQKRPPKRTTTPNTWRRSSRSRSSPASTRRSPTSTLLVAPHRSHRHREPSERHALPARGRFGLGHDQCLDALSPTVSSTAWAPRSASPPTRSTPAARSASKA